MKFAATENMKLVSLGADAIETHTESSWNKIEERRGELIRKKNFGGGLDSAEMDEFVWLQKATTQRANLLFPTSDKKLKEFEEFVRNFKAPE